MYFKQIELAGFKSFADRINIKFDSGITAIVGPNGCGKSNVADAIRWVLGEQSSKQLRGSSMQDVIFNGTKKRKSLSYCEATLTFNNQDRYFNIDYDELEVTRKIYRNGESEYLINKHPCRLKDITDIFYDSGIGRDGYSIIGQGKVEEILSSRPENRRAIFEEAAGIAKYKYRKLEAERKLERTRDNLVRLRDILAELESQLGPLKKQAENAKKYLSYKAELKDHEINAYIYQYENANETKERISTKLNSINEEMDLRNADFEKINFEFENETEKLNSIDSIITKLHDKILLLTVGIEKQSGEEKLINERIKNYSIQNDKLELEISNSEQLLEKSQKEKVEKNWKLLEIIKETENLKNSLTELSVDYLNFSEEIKKCEGEAEEKTRELISSTTLITDIKSTFSKLKAEEEMLNNLLYELTKKQEINEEKILNHEKAKKECEKSCNDAKKESEKLFSEITKTSQNFEKLNNEIKILESTNNKLFANLAVFENRKNLLIQMQKEYEGYYYSIKKLLKDSEKNLELKSKMLGVLASLIKVPQKFEMAIETALGTQVQNIVTFNEQNAKDLIDYLKKNEYGRATFLPISTIKPRFLSVNEQRAIKIDGCFGVASRLITYDTKISNIIENLLGTTIIATDLKVAIEISKSLDYGLRIVTLDGDVINPQGSFTGGSRKNDSVNLIAREREIETLTKEIEENSKKYNETEEKIKNNSKICEELTKKINDLILLKGQSDILVAKENEKLTAINNSLNELLNLKQEYKNQLKDFQIKLENLTKENAKAKALEKETGSKDFSEENLKRIENVSELRTKLEHIANNITSIKIKIASLEAQEISLNDEIARIDGEISSSQVTIEDNKSLLERNIEIVEQAKKLAREKAELSANLHPLDELEEAKSKQQELTSSKSKMQKILKDLNEERNNLIENLNKIKERKYQQEMELAKVDTDIETMQERIYEEYQLTYDKCLEFKRADFDINLAMTEINKLKRNISHLGYVNVNAIEDSKIVLERYEALATQEKDLIYAEKDLLQIISELSSEMESKFKKEFEKINENFQITFRELFGGGRASLELLDEENILESGIEIVAEPPGKNLNNLSLLSGGEKALTAIAILFAMLRMRTLPFCLLDEIEAALDETNVSRFAKYLHKFSKNTQFIVITHRKPTMELADSLYGVTMEEEGVSRIVSVKLSEAVLNAKENDETGVKEDEVAS